MKLTKKLTNGNHVVTMTVSTETFTKARENAKKSILANLEIKGFRKGKVPANIAEQYVTPQRVSAQASEKLIDANYSQVMKELQTENIISRPQIEVTKISDSELEVTFSSAVYPEIKLPDMKYSAKWEMKEVSKDDLKQEVDRFEQNLIEVKPISEDRAAVKGDITNINFLGKLNGTPFEGGKAEGFDLELGSGQFIPGFEEQVEGMKSGEDKVITVTFPKEYPSANLAGQEVTFDVKLNSIKAKAKLEGKDLEKRLQAMGFKSADDMRSKIEIMMKDRMEQAANDNFFQRVMDEIVAHKDSNIEIPATLIADEINNQFNNFKQTIAQQGMELKAYLEMLGTTEEEFKNKQIKAEAEKRIKSGLIYTELIKKHDVKATDALVKAELEKIAKIQDMDVKEIEKNINIEQFKDALVFQELIKVLKG